jgi:hypothetical protein
LSDPGVGGILPVGVSLSQRNGAGGNALAFRDQYGGGRLLLTDSRIALLLCDEARHQGIERLFGLPRNQANLATFVAALALAQAAQDGLRRLAAPGGKPTLADGVIGVSMVRELLGRAAGPSSRETPLVGTLITIAFLGAGARAVARRTGHAVRSGTHRADLGFRHRYGYLVDPGHWRQRRFERREQAAKAASA